MNTPTDRVVGRSTLRVRYAETDTMGIAYYANYLVWFEVARTDFLRQNGVRYRDLEASGIYLPVGSVEARMLRPAYYDDELGIDCWIEELRSRRIVLGYAVWRLVESGDRPSTVAGEESIATGKTALVCVGEDRRPKSFPAEVRAKMAGLLPG